MLERIRNFPKSCEEALEKKLDVPENYKKISNIIFSGMGGSAIPGDIVKDWLRERIKISIEVSRDFELPAYADDSSLLFCISYSGNTKETLTQLEEGIKRKCKIIGMASGGELAAKCKELKLPLVEVPAGMCPREALPHLLFSVINALRELKIAKLDFSPDDLERHKEEVEESAKEMAKSINATLPIVCSTYHSACLRFKHQLNENSKLIAKCEVLPEMSHNEIESWKHLNKKFSLIFMREEEENEHIKGYIENLKLKMKGRTNCLEVFAKGKSRLERILYLIWVGDFVSYFLAEEIGEDPSRSFIRDELKAKVYSAKI